MGNTRNTGYLGNVIKVSDTGNITFVSGSTVLMSVSSSGAVSSSATTVSSSISNLVVTNNAVLGSNETSTVSIPAFIASDLYPVASTYKLGSPANYWTRAYVQTGSFDEINVTGRITAQTLVVQTVTSSVDYVTGSTQFGSLLSNTHVFSGSVSMNPGGLFVSSSGLVGIGNTSPNFRLEVIATNNDTNQIVGYFGKTGGNTYGSTILRIARNAGVTTTGSFTDSAITDIEQNSGGSGPFRFGSTYADTIIYNGANATGGPYGSIHFATSGSITMTVGGGTIAGRVGIGTTTPNNLLSVRGNLDLGATGLSYVGPSQYGGITFPRGQILFSNTNTQNQLYIASNAYNNGSGVFAYRNSSQPTVAIGLDNGGISFLTAGNGTADAAISWNTPLLIDNTGVYYTNTLTPVNLKPENTPATVITNLASAASTYNYKPGVYWIGYGGYTFLAYVKFNWHQGRNWVLALKCHNVHDMPAGSALWQNNTLINQSDFNLHSGRMAKYAAWNYFPFTRLLYEMGNRIPPIMQWNSQKTSLYSVFSGITVSNGSGVGPDSTDPKISTSATTTYYGMTNFLGDAFPSAYGGAEVNLNYYGLGSFANNSTNSTSATNTGVTSGFGLTTEHLGAFSGLQSTGRSGAWIGCPLDEGGHVFNAASSVGADSGFGLGVAGGNNARTTTSGIISWALGNNVANFLPAYVWLSID